jgi:hypothetical protein
VAAWKSEAHLLDHFGYHRGELRVRSIAEYDASAQETIEIAVHFTYRDFITGENHIGYYHRDSARFVGTTLDNLIVTHFRTDEDYVATLDRSTYED